LRRKSAQFSFPICQQRSGRNDERAVVLWSAF
jgi:hypothetical protein